MPVSRAVREPAGPPRAIIGFAAMVLAATFGVACGGSGGEGGPARVLLVTTTTVEASGLLDELVAAYHGAQDRYRLSVTAVGSGAALAIGRRGDADLLVTHDPTGEAAFMAAGHGTAQGPLMRNEFIVVGPRSDPAGVRGVTDLAEALRRIAAAGAPFVSRGDESGTHRRERQIWHRVGRTPWEARPDWYLQAGSGMDETLRVAEQRAAYTLSGRSTYLNLRDGLTLQTLARGRPPEINPYQWTLPEAPPNPAGARSLRDWLVGPGQQVIGAYGVEEFGEPLFTPTAPPGTRPAVGPDSTPAADTVAPARAAPAAGGV